MDVSKILLAVSALLLAVCLVLSISTLTSLRHAVAENKEVQLHTALTVESLGAYVEVLNQSSEKEPSVEVSADADPVPTKGGFTLRLCDEKLCIFTADGYLVKTIDLSPETLPPSVRESLAKGISAEDWQSLLKLIEDLTT